MGGHFSRSTGGATKTKKIDVARDEPVIGTCVDVAKTHHELHELFRAGGIHVTRCDSNRSYIIEHGKRRGTFNSQLALVEAFLAEVRANMVTTSLSHIQPACI